MKLLGIALVMGIIVPAPGGDVKAEAKKDLAALQGEWNMVAGVNDGWSIPAEARAGAKRVCRGNETTVSMNGMLLMKAKFTLDPSKKPSAIDYHRTVGPKGPTTSDTIQRGIYEIHNGSVRFCFAETGKPRPTRFSSEKGSGWTLTRWKRSRG